MTRGGRGCGLMLVRGKGSPGTTPPSVPAPSEFRARISNSGPQPGEEPMMSRRGLIRTALATFGMSGLPRGAAALVAGELALPGGASEERVDFAAGLDRWTTVAGRWTLEDM